MYWKWINDNGDIYLRSKVATVIIHGYQPHAWDIESFEQHSDIILHTPFDYDLVLLSAWRFFVLHDLFL